MLSLNIEHRASSIEHRVSSIDYKAIVKREERKQPPQTEPFLPTLHQHWALSMKHRLLSIKHWAMIIEQQPNKGKGNLSKQSPFSQGFIKLPLPHRHLLLQARVQVFQPAWNQASTNTQNNWMDFSPIHIESIWNTAFTSTQNIYALLTCPYQLACQSVWSATAGPTCHSPVNPS